MKLSVKVEYACRVMIHMARLHASGTLAHIEDLARAEAIPQDYLPQILGELRNGGLITSRRGKQGGYALARNPEEISLCDIVTVIEGDLLELNESSQKGAGRRVTEAWREIRKILEEKTREITLDRLAARSGELMYFI